MGSLCCTECSKELDRHTGYDYVSCLKKTQQRLSHMIDQLEGEDYGMASHKWQFEVKDFLQVGACN